MTGRILIIDDEEKLRSLLARIIAMEGHEVIEAGDIKTGMKKLSQSVFDIVLCDVKLPDGNGLDTVKSMKQKYPEVEVILLTAFGNIPDGIQAMKNGAFDYLTKGDDNQRILPLISKALEKVSLTKRIGHLERQLERSHSFDAIVGNSKSIQLAIELAEKVAPTDTTVLLTGETGTGKEIFANAIHQASQRKQKPFVAINCSAFSRELLESELFGHAAGAFTGAMREKRGLMEEANKGTLFMDEIGEMPLELQAKILRAIEQGEFLRVGETKTTKVDLRIIAATHRDLAAEVKEGRFRQDLFFRLSVFQIALPPLRARVQDIPSLAQTFIELFCLKTNQPVKAMSPEYLTALRQYQWPGNIRELKNIIERSVILQSGPVLTSDVLPHEMLTPPSAEQGKQLSAFSLASAEKLHIQKVLNYTGGNKAETARLLGIGVTTLYRKIDEYKLS